MKRMREKKDRAEKKGAREKEKRESERERGGEDGEKNEGWEGREIKGRLPTHHRSAIFLVRS